MALRVKIELQQIDLHKLNEPFRNEYIFRIKFFGDLIVFERKQTTSGAALFPISFHYNETIVDHTFIEVENMPYQFTLDVRVVEDDPFFDDIAESSFSFSIEPQNAQSPFAMNFSPRIKDDSEGIDATFYFLFQLEPTSSPPIP
ncbi:hypothetical protein [Paenibacillus montanisoli]|uniref:Uncharacterized protein n=1 Tax=Paenibacillus montanisoli TaxID=2081970 RepID=A0A328U6I0_9BACL|nr:hypothetical protein [Paenibacillus montanisoli]RAP78468.1 hypothetical protein DL346_08620 [Paenibacillus montanisoli]